MEDPRSTTPNSSNKQAASSPQYKRYQQARQAFWQCWQQDWSHTKTMVDALLASAVDLKHRLQLLHQQQKNPPHHNSMLTADDMALALRYTYRKYEYTWQQLRGVLAQLAADQQSLGRRLHHVLTMAAATESLETTDCTTLYQTVAVELYQTQTRAQLLLDQAYDL